METGLTIEHPYWDVYQRLLSLKKDKNLKEELRKIAGDFDFSLENRLQLETTMLIPWFQPHMVYQLFFSKMREKFCYSILTPETLKFLLEFSPLVEMGAGNGYNAWLLRQLGAEIEAIEAFPVEEGRNWFFNTNSFGLPGKRGRSWTPITKGDAKDLEHFPDHALLMVWPPINSMASDSLKHYKGSTIVLIANRKNCGNTAFYKALTKDWHLVYSTESGGWSGFQVEWLELYVRSGTELPQTHLHYHSEFEHTHVHLHDEHHNHDHEHEYVGIHPHEHKHKHTNMSHSHSHIGDEHHRHHFHEEENLQHEQVDQDHPES